MTKFTRAKGPKAWKERVAEDTSSWHEMKQQTLDKSKESADDVARQDSNQKGPETYRTFLEEEQEGAVQCSEFPGKSSKSSKVKILLEGYEDAPLEVSSKIQPKTLMVKTKNTSKKKRKWSVSTVPAQKIRNETMSSDEKLETLTGVDQNEGEESVLNSKIAVSVAKKIAVKGPKTKQQAKKISNPVERQLTEKDLKKIQKKNQRRLRQIAKRKEFKEELRQFKEMLNALETPVVDGVSKPVKIKEDPEAKEDPKVKVKDQKYKSFKKRNQLKFNEIMVHGRKITLAYFDGFRIKKEDAIRLKALKNDMVSKGLPRSQISAALKVERRRAEKALSREKHMECFHCHKVGHNFSECPEVSEDQTGQFRTNVCFKCGSTEHTQIQCKVKGDEYKFASCFICKKQGHISRQCPDNTRGLYPKGGACKVCGDVTHLKKDCPQHQAQQQSTSDMFKVEILNGGNPDVMEVKVEKPHPGGACKVCGDVTHLKMDCPQHQAQQQSTSDMFKVETLNDGNSDVMEVKVETQ